MPALSVAWFGAFLLVVPALIAPGTLYGRVVRDDTGAPVPHARIVAAKVGGSLSDYRAVVADATGGFHFIDLAPGRYRIYAEREGYLRGEYGRYPVSSSGTPVSVAAGQTSAAIVVTMTPTAAIAGHVDEDGHPAAHVWVRALKSRFVDGRRTCSVAAYAATDDRGEYRLFDLPPGRYVVSAIPQTRPRIENSEIVTPTVPSRANGNRSKVRMPLTADNVSAMTGRPGVYPAVYYPSTTEVERAAVLDITAGDVRSGIDFTVARGTVFHIRGRVTTTVASTSGIIVSAAPVVMSTNPAVPTRHLDAAGAFDLGGLLPGTYTVFAQTTTGPAQLFVSTPLQVVDHDVDGVSLVLQPGTRIAGHVSVDGVPGVGGRSMHVGLTRHVPPIWGYGIVPVQPDGAFAFSNVAPGDYDVRVLLPRADRSLWVEAERFDGASVLDSPIHVEPGRAVHDFDLVLNSATAALDALVLDDRQQPAAGVLVIAVPESGRRGRSDRYRWAVTDTTGRAHVDGLEPGEYTVFASTRLNADDWQDPNVLARHASEGHDVRLSDGGAARLTLRATP
jgi:hypothetical protein